MAREENITQYKRRVFLAPKSSDKKGYFVVKLPDTQGKYHPKYYKALEGYIKSVDMQIISSEEYGASAYYSFEMDEQDLGEISIFVQVESTRCCRLLNEFFCVDTSKPCDMQVYAYDNYIGITIANSGKAKAELKFPKIENKDGQKGDTVSYEGVPDVKKVPKMKNDKEVRDVKGVIQYESDSSERVDFFLVQLCNLYPKMFGGDVFTPTILATDPSSPFSEIIFEANQRLMSGENEPEAPSADKEFRAFLEKNKAALINKIKDALVGNESDIVERVSVQYKLLYQKAQKEQANPEIATDFYSAIFMDALHEARPQYAPYPKAFIFEKGLVKFNQPNFNHQETGDDLPF